jgi:hypothetical protein
MPLGDAAEAHVIGEKGGIGKIALLVLLARTSLSKIRNKTVPRFHTSPKAVVTTDLLPNNGMPLAKSPSMKHRIFQQSHPS